MKITNAFILFFILNVLSLSAKHCCGCIPGPTGPRGPRGLQGPPGPAGTFISQYASGKANAEIITYSNQIIPIEFQENFTTPVGIIHPVSGNNAEFEITSDGNYFLSWTVNFAYSSAIRNVISFFIYINNVQIFVTTSGFETNPDDATNERYLVVNGQFITALSAGDVLEVRTNIEETPTFIERGSFNIIKISD